jgi:hypothetical protein
MEGKSPSTAYEISRIEQNAATVLGLFVQMIAQHVKDFGKLRLGDIIQYLTIAEVDKIESNKELVYKTFLLHDKKTGGSTKTRKIKFDNTLSNEPIGPEDKLDMSYDVLKEEGGIGADTEIYKVNPELFRDLCYTMTVSPDVLNPRSEDLERAYNIETYDRMILNPVANQEEALRLLLSTDPKTKRNPDKYVAKQTMQLSPMQTPNAPIKPTNSLPQNPGVGQM